MERIGSPLFVGRTAELSMLADAFDRAVGGSPQIALISAEAGGGKTRLIREFCERSKDRAAIIAGGCTNQSAPSLPYAPFTAALRGLVRKQGVSDVVELIGTGSAGDLAWLLPEFGAPRALPDMTIGRSRLFEVVRLLIERLARQRPLVWVLEDLHWADASTRDLLRHLAANIAEAPVLLLVSYRSDSIARTDPMRTVLAELGRLRSIRFIRLPRLTRSEVATQLKGIVGRELDAAVVGAVYARGAGVPLFTEALIGSDGGLRRHVPENVNDLLLCAVRELPRRTQAVLRAASLAGSQVGHSLLAAALGLREAELDAHIEPAVAGNLLQVRDVGYVFRHDLIREAVEGDMLVGERKRLHRAYASALEAAPAAVGDTWLSPALARHWHLAGEHARSIAAAWRGAREAKTASAHDEQLGMLELVLEQWPRLPDAGALIGTTRIDVLEEAADAACWAARPDRGMVLAEAALSQSREAGDAERVAALLLQRAPMRHQQLVPGQMEDLHEAWRLSAGHPPLRLECLGQLCRALMIRERPDDAEPHARELEALASRTRDETAGLDARITRAILDARHGADRSAALEAAAADCRRSGSGWLEVLALNAIAESHAGLGRHELAIDTACRAAKRSVEVGQVGYLGPSIAQSRARAMLFAGRWDEAVQVLEQALDLDPAPFGRALLTLCRAEIAVLRGDLEGASRGLAYLEAFPLELLARPLSIRRLRLEIHLARGDPAGAARAAFDVPDACLAAAVQEAWPLLALAARVSVDAGADAAWRARLVTTTRRLPRSGPVERAFADTVAAEQSRMAERAPAEPWIRAAAAWAALGHPFHRAYCLMRAAATESARAAAAQFLGEASALAARLGAGPLLQRIDVVARRRRLGPHASEPAAGAKSLFALTGREMEVLELLAEGRTNRQIAAALVISAKTVSVHVTNVLSKLDVRTRGAAAAVAHRVGLVEPVQPSARA